MRHKYKGRKLGTSYGHTKAMKVGLVQALFLNDRIKTTETRAKEIRGNVDRIITWAKKGDLHSRRLAIAALNNNSDLVREIFEKVQQGMFKDRPGGYTRIMKLGPRKGDGAPMVIIELVTETCVPKAEKKAAAAKPAKKKATPSKKDVKDAEKDVKAEEKEAEEHHESLIDEIKENFEAAEETFAENVREEGEEQLAEEKAEVAAEDAAAEAKDAEKEAAEQDAAEAEARQAEEKVEETERAEEKIRKEEAKAEEERAKDAEAEAPNPALMPESEEHAN